MKQLFILMSILFSQTIFAEYKAEYNCVTQENKISLRTATDLETRRYDEDRKIYVYDCLIITREKNFIRCEYSQNIVKGFTVQTYETITEETKGYIKLEVDDESGDAIVTVEENKKKAIFKSKCTK